MVRSKLTARARTGGPPIIYRVSIVLPPTRAEKLWKDFKQYRWNKTNGVEENLTKILKIWWKLKKEEGELKPLEAVEKVLKIIPVELKLRANKIYNNINDHTLEGGGAFDFCEFMYRLMHEWSELVYGEVVDSSSSESDEFSSSEIEESEDEEGSSI